MLQHQGHRSINLSSSQCNSSGTSSLLFIITGNSFPVFYSCYQFHRFLKQHLVKWNQSRTGFFPKWVRFVDLSACLSVLSVDRWIYCNFSVVINGKLTGKVELLLTWNSQAFASTLQTSSGRSALKNTLVRKGQLTSVRAEFVVELHLVPKKAFFACWFRAVFFLDICACYVLV